MLMCVRCVSEWLNVLLQVQYLTIMPMHCTHACYSYTNKTAERFYNLYYRDYKPLLNERFSPVSDKNKKLYNGSMHSCIFIRKHQYKNLLPFIFHQRLPWQELLWAFLTHFCGSQSLSGRRWFPLISYKMSVNMHNKRTNKYTSNVTNSK